MATVLFVCLHNAGRSQMSAALFEHRRCDERPQAFRGRPSEPQFRRSV